MVVQRISKQYTDEVSVGIKYYSLISELNNLNLTDRELQLLAFTAHRGTISSLSAKQEFARRFHSSIPTINNMISKLSRMGLFIKVKGKTKVNPKIALDFSTGIVLQIIMTKKEENGQAS
jgi:DNA-binding MarR family transcriptional regulator